MNLLGHNFHVCHSSWMQKSHRMKTILLRSWLREVVGGGKDSKVVVSMELSP